MVHDVLSGRSIRTAHFVIGRTISSDGVSWNPPLPSCSRPAADTTQTMGEQAYFASNSPGTRFAIPGPGLACTTPTRPDTRA